MKCGRECDRAQVTEEVGVSCEMAPTEIGVLWRWFRIRTKSKSLGMKINTLVEVFWRSEVRTAFVKKSKPASGWGCGLRLRLEDLFL